MFRIDRSRVNLSATRYILEIAEIDAGVYEEEIEIPAGREAGAEGEEQAAPDASASVAERAKEMLDEAEKEAASRAGGIIAAAREEAEALLGEAMKNAEEERAEAKRQGYEEGREAGYGEGLANGAAEGRRDFDAKIKEDDEKLLGVVGEIYDEMELLGDMLESEVVSLSMEIVKKVIDPSEESGQTYKSLIKHALSQMRTDRNIVIRVGRDEHKRFFPSGSAEFKLDSGVTVKAAVLEDQTLGSGDVVIDAGEETVNAGLDSQLSYIQLAFDRAVD